jgi:hypothetical protein
MAAKLDNNGFKNRPFGKLQKIFWKAGKYFIQKKWEVSIFYK